MRFAVANGSKRVPHQKPGNLLIRSYTPADRLACLEIFESNCPLYLDPSEKEGFEVWLDGLDRQEVAYSNAEANAFNVLQLNGKVIACGGFYITKSKPDAVMAWGMVGREYHKQGFGRQLFQHRIAQINAQYPEHTIKLDTSQHTYRFFEQFGFSVSRVTKDAYGPGLDRYDMQL